MSLKSPQESRGKKCPQHPSTCIEKLNILENKSKNHVFKRFRELQSSVEPDLNTTPRGSGDLAAALSWQSFLMLVQARESVLGLFCCWETEKPAVWLVIWDWSHKALRDVNYTAASSSEQAALQNCSEVIRGKENKSERQHRTAIVGPGGSDQTEGLCAAPYRGWENKCDHSREITVALTSGVCMEEVSKKIRTRQPVLKDLTC